MEDLNLELLPDQIKKVEMTSISGYIKNQKIYLDLYMKAETETKIYKFKIAGFDTGIKFVNAYFDETQSIKDCGEHLPPIKTIEKKLGLNGKQYSIDDITFMGAESKPKEVTMADIEKKFGCKVKIVGE